MSDIKRIVIELRKQISGGKAGAGQGTSGGDAPRPAGGAQSGSKARLPVDTPLGSHQAQKRAKQHDEQQRRNRQAQQESRKDRTMGLTPGHSKRTPMTAQIVPASPPPVGASGPVNAVPVAQLVPGSQGGSQGSSGGHLPPGVGPIGTKAPAATPNVPAGRTSTQANAGFPTGSKGSRTGAGTPGHTNMRPPPTRRKRTPRTPPKAPTVPRGTKSSSSGSEFIRQATVVGLGGRAGAAVGVANAAGKAVAGLSGVASAAGPVGLALGAVTVAGLGAVAMFGGLVASGRAVDKFLQGLSDNLSGFEGNLAGAVAFREVAMLQNRMRQGQELGPQLARFNEERMHLDRAMLDIQTEIAKTLLPIANNVLPDLVRVADSVSELVGTVGESNLVPLTIEVLKKIIDHHDKVINRANWLLETSREMLGIAQKQDQQTANAASSALQSQMQHFLLSRSVDLGGTVGGLPNTVGPYGNLRPTP